MTVDSGLDAQRRVDDIQAFNRELAELEREGGLALTSTQRAVIDRYHQGLISDFRDDFDIDPNQRAKQLSRGMQAATLLGALALAASAFFGFYRIWGGLTTTVQVGVLLAGALLSFVGVFAVRRFARTAYFVKLVAIFAFACFVLDIFMLGQIFNIAPSDRALVPWAALALLLAYLGDVRLLLAAGIGCAIVYGAAQVGIWGGYYWIHFPERPENFLVAGALCFCVPLVFAHRRHPAFPPIYRFLGLAAVFIPLLVLGSWGEGSYLQFDPEAIEVGYQVVGFLACFMAIWLGARRGWTEVSNGGLGFFVILLMIKFFDWWWEIIPRYLFFLLIALTAILFIFILRRLRMLDLDSDLEGAR